MAAIAPNRTSEAYEFGAFRLIPAEHQLLHEGKPIPLPPKAFETLVVLVARGGHLVEKEELMQTLWPDSFVEEANLTHHVWTIRKALGDGENGLRYIETVPRRGYRFVADVQHSMPGNDEVVLEKHTLTEIVSETTEHEVISDRSSLARERVAEVNKPSQVKWLLRIGAITLAIALVVTAVAVYRYARRQPGPTRIDSIAVMAFANESGNQELDFLADGLNESLSSGLARMPQLSVFRYSGKSLDTKQVAAQLSAQAVLNGRVVQHGDTVAVYMTLVDGPTGKQLWGEQYNRKMTDLVGLQKDIAGDVSQKLRSQITPNDRQRLTGSGTENNDAYQSYIKGRYYWSRPGSPGYAKSIEYFQRAIDLDPNYAAAYAGIAHYYGFGAALGAMPPDENWPKSEAALTKALSIDDSSADSFNVLAGIQLYYHRDWPAAERSFRRGIELNPNSAEVHHHYGRCLYLFGRNEEAITELQRAIAIDPLSQRYQLNLGITFYSIRDYDRAMNQIRSALELEPNFAAAHEWLGNVYRKKGMQTEAVAEWASAWLLRRQPERAAELERVYSKSGFDAAVNRLGEQRLQDFNESSTRGEYVAAIDYVNAYTRMGNVDLAIDWVAKALQERNRFAYEIKIDPRYDDLRSNPRFEPLLRRFGFQS